MFLDQREDQETVVLLVLLDLKEAMVMLEHQDHKVFKAYVVLLVVLEFKVDQEVPEREVFLDLMVKLENQDHKDFKVFLDQWDYKETRV